MNCKSFLLLGTATQSLTLTALKSDLLKVSKSTVSANSGSISTLEKDFSSLKPNVDTGTKLGVELGKRLIEKNITSVVFDRNGYLYHGVVKAIADGARSAGVKF